VRVKKPGQEKPGKSRPGFVLLFFLCLLGATGAGAATGVCWLGEVQRERERVEPSVEFPFHTLSKTASDDGRNIAVLSGRLCREGRLVEAGKLARQGRFDYLLVESTGILEPLRAAERRLGRRTVLTFPLLPPPPKK
jgi:hypothetical protein